MVARRRYVATVTLAWAAAVALADPPPPAPTWEESVAQFRAALAEAAPIAGRPDTRGTRALGLLTRWAHQKTEETVDLALPVLARDEPGIEDAARRLLGRIPDGPVWRRLLDASLGAGGGPILRRNLLAVFEQSRAETVATALGDLLRRETEPALRIRLCRLVAARGAAAAREPVLALVGEGEEGVRVAAIEALGAIGLPDDAPRLTEFLDRRSEPALAAAAFDALVRLEGATLSEDQVEPFLRDRAPAELRVAATRATALLPEGERARLLDGLPREPLWQVRLAGAQVLAVTRRLEAVDLLVEMLRREEEPRMVGEIATALETLTGVHYAPDKALDSWNGYWRANRERFRFGEPRPDAAPGDAGVGQAVQTPGAFYGVPVDTGRPVFVLDISGSMSASQGRAKEEGKNRLDLAKEHLCRAVEALPRGARFNVVFFESGVRSWRETLAEATPADVAACLEFVRSQRPTGGTNIMDALDAALRTFDGGGPGDAGGVAGYEVMNAIPDTIYLLSDGSPSAGRITDEEGILQEVDRINRNRQVRIHAISIGTDSAFMRRLAERNRGTYVHVPD